MLIILEIGSGNQNERNQRKMKSQRKALVQLSHIRHGLKMVFVQPRPPTHSGPGLSSGQRGCVAPQGHPRMLSQDSDQNLASRVNWSIGVRDSKFTEKPQEWRPENQARLRVFEGNYSRAVRFDFLSCWTRIEV